MVNVGILGTGVSMKRGTREGIRRSVTRWDQAMYQSMDQVVDQAMANWRLSNSRVFFYWKLTDEWQRLCNCHVHVAVVCFVVVESVSAKKTSGCRVQLANAGRLLSFMQGSTVGFFCPIFASFKDLSPSWSYWGALLACCDRAGLCWGVWCCGVTLWCEFLLLGKMVTYENLKSASCSEFVCEHNALSGIVAKRLLEPWEASIWGWSDPTTVRDEIHYFQTSVAGASVRFEPVWHCDYGDWTTMRWQKQLFQFASFDSREPYTYGSIARPVGRQDETKEGDVAVDKTSGDLWEFLKRAFFWDWVGEQNDTLYSTTANSSSH